MAASESAFQPRGGGILLVLVLAIAALVFLSPLAAMEEPVDVGAADEVVNVPEAQPVNQHAVEGHAEATNIFARYQQGDYSCLRVYRSLSRNRLLWRFTFSDTSLEGGMITAVSGRAITAYLQAPAYWGGVICRDGYSEIMLVTGECPPEMGCD